MRIELNLKKLRSDFVKKIEELSGQSLMSCYQCGKCSAGCPMVSAMDILPNQAIRLAQLGLQKDVLESKAIWLCASCVTCGARCPRGVDLSRIMEPCGKSSFEKNTTGLICRRFQRIPSPICPPSHWSVASGKTPVSRGEPLWI
jgi:heterodisulfide reductase subunit C